jgi:hypothetical protein
LECVCLGVVIKSSSVPLLRGNRIFESGTTVIVIRSDAGLFSAYMNNFAYNKETYARILKAHSHSMRFNLSFSWVSLLFLNSWRASVIPWHDYLWNKTPWQGKQFFAVDTSKSNLLLCMELLVRVVCPCEWTSRTLHVQRILQPMKI